jgi:purine nucleosidase
MRPFIIDTDTASDDAVALIMALRWPDVDVKAITVVAGNVPLEQAVSNALYTVELCGSQVPVYAGADRPILRRYEHAQWYHGKDGLGDRGYPPPKGKAAPGHGVQAMIDTIMANPGIVLVTLGPLTNIGLAIRQEPRIVENVSRCVMMGGAACTVGNVTPAAEYNVWVDPEAAQIMFNSGMKVEMAGWELCRGDANIRMNEIDLIKSFNTPLAHFSVDCNATAIEANFTQSGERGIALPDPVGMAIALDPEGVIKRSSMHDVVVETQSELTRGMTVVDQLGVGRDERNRALWDVLAGPHKSIRVIWEIDIPRWKEMLYTVLR